MSPKVKKMIHIAIITIIIVAIAFTALILILRYNEEGETNMPFEVSKITIISTTDAEDVEDEENIWNKIINQNNDIYIDIKKNDDYSKTQILEKVILNNFQITTKPEKGNITIYMPSTSEVATFENKDEYETSEIVFTGDQSTDIQNLQISNQGGRVAFRCANNNLGSYISNSKDDLDYSNLLNLIGISEQELQTTFSFDIEITLSNNIAFKSTIELAVPIDGIVENGTSSTEITDLDIVFKRIEN